jgi:hypothetical protein
MELRHVILGLHGSGISENHNSRNACGFKNAYCWNDMQLNREIAPFPELAATDPKMHVPFFSLALNFLNDVNLQSCSFGIIWFFSTM